MRRFMLPVLFLSLLCCSGCKKISPEAKILIDTVSLVSKERAASFVLIKDKLKSADEKDAVVFAAYCVSHQTALESISKGLFDITKSLEKSDCLEERTIEQLKSLAATLKASSQNFHALDSGFIVAKNPEEAVVVAQWAEAHRAGLNKMVEFLEKLKSVLEKQDKKKQTELTPERREQFRRELAAM